MKKIDLDEVTRRAFVFRPDEAYSIEEVLAQFRRWRSEAFVCQRGETCIKSGSPANEFVLIVSGVLYVRIPSEMGDDILLRVARQGEYIGLRWLFSSEKTSPYDVVAAAESEIIVFSVDEVRRWRMDPKSQPLFDFLGKHLCQEIRAAQTKAMILSGTDIADRLRRYLALRMHEDHSRRIVIPGSAGDLANYLGVNRSALSRVMSKLSADGKIKYRRGVITVL